MYYWKHGWSFRREVDGSVSILHDEHNGPMVEIPADEWASIVHAVAHPDASYNAIRAAIGGPECNPNEE